MRYRLPTTRWSFSVLLNQAVSRHSSFLIRWNVSYFFSDLSRDSRFLYLEKVRKKKGKKKLFWGIVH